MAKVIKFTQEVCPKCDILESVLEAMEQEVDEVIVIKDENRQEAKEKYNLMGTPTMIAFDDDGNEIARTSAHMYGQVEDFFTEVK